MIFSKSLLRTSNYKIISCRFYDSTILSLTTFIMSLTAHNPGFFFPDPVLSTIPVYNTVTQSRCPTRDICSGSSGITAFQPNYAYTYDYEIETVSEMRGSSDNESKLKLKARAIVYVKSACDFTMRVHMYLYYIQLYIRYTV